MLSICCNDNSIFFKNYKLLIINYKLLTFVFISNRCNLTFNIIFVSLLLQFIFYNYILKWLFQLKSKYKFSSNSI